MLNVDLDALKKELDADNSRLHETSRKDENEGFLLSILGVVADNNEVLRAIKVIRKYLATKEKAKNMAQ